MRGVRHRAGDEGQDAPEGDEDAAPARRVRRRRITLLPRPLLSLMPVSTSSELPAADGEQRRPGARLRFAVAVVGWLVLALLGVAAVLREVAPERTRWLILLATLTPLLYLPV